jgi:hypothetical protein
LSLASKHCCAITNPYRFRNIHLHVYAEDCFLVDIQHWGRVLEDIDGFHMVRRLSVDGQAPVAQRNNPQYCADTRSPTFVRTGFIAEDEWMDRGSRYSDLHSSRDRTVVDGVPKDSKITTTAELDAWRPFCGFFSEATGTQGPVLDKQFTVSALSAGGTAPRPSELPIARQRLQDS